ncbi:hypothetical protein F5884DRAFT_854716 [Xylogone sp. PMI_703]|nr:hypothetical protein F5884DRAFT_854716 [Xylogone sp. PMI_703]
MDSDLTCQICYKVFSKKILRDRHTRRCVRSFNKPRVSKQKACISCARSKLRCTTERPCARCLNRGLACVYASSEDRLPEDQTPQTEEDQAVPALSEVNMDRLLDINPSDNDITVDYSNDVWLQGMNLFLEEDIPLELREHPSFHSARESDPIDVNSHRDAFELSLTPQSSLMAINIQDTIKNDAAFPEAAVSQGRIILTLPARPSITHLIEFTRKYPVLMLEKDFWPPFIHSNLYRCSEGGVAKQLAIALSCFGAKINCLQSGTDFIALLLNRERDQVIKEFPTFKCLKDAVAGLHALCIYQIAGLFDECALKRSKSEMTSAQLYHTYLLKITRQLYHRYKALIFDTSGSSWNSYQASETLRRTIHLVNVINILSYRSNALIAHYYEPLFMNPEEHYGASLDSNAILDIPLPSSDTQWKACSSDKWNAARTKDEEMEQWASRGKPTLRKLMKSPSQLLEEYENDIFPPTHGTSTTIDESREFCKLIIACAMLS